MYKKAFIFLVIYLQTINCQIVLFPDNREIYLNSGVNPNIKHSPNSESFHPNSLLDLYKNYNRIGRAINSFSVNINKAILNRFDETPTENIIISPLSIVGALSLLLLGSSGQTYTELANALQFFNDYSNSQNVHRDFGMLLEKLIKKDESNDNSRNISYASAVFLQNDYPINQQYEDVVRNVYKSEIKHVDYKYRASRAQWIINKWVSDKTYGKIQNILTALPSSDTRLIIGSALYFRAEWEKYFLDGLTKRSTFTPDKRNPENALNVDMMANEGYFPFLRSIEHGCVLVGLPYKGNKTMLYAIKPIDSTKKSLKELMNQMNEETLEYLIRNARKQSTIVLFPKMKLSSVYNLKTILEDLGVTSVFSKVDANLGQISNQVATAPPPTADGDRLIFTRIGSDVSDDNCREVFDLRSVSQINCTATETVNGRKILVIYKRIGDKVGRRIVKRYVNNKDRTKRQTAVQSDNPGLYVDEVIHKVDISFTETGTEAAAATMVLISRDGRRPVFVADEPFFFLIRDEDSGIPLFSGSIYKPLPNYT